MKAVWYLMRTQMGWPLAGLLVLLGGALTLLVLVLRLDGSLKSMEHAMFYVVFGAVLTSVIFQRSLAPYRLAWSLVPGMHTALFALSVGIPLALVSLFSVALVGVLPLSAVVAPWLLVVGLATLVAAWPGAWVGFVPTVLLWCDNRSFFIDSPWFLGGIAVAGLGMTVAGWHRWRHGDRCLPPLVGPEAGWNFGWLERWTLPGPRRIGGAFGHAWSLVHYQVPLAVLVGLAIGGVAVVMPILVIAVPSLVLLGPFNALDARTLIHGTLAPGGRARVLRSWAIQPLVMLLVLSTATLVGWWVVAQVAPPRQGSLGGTPPYVALFSTGLLVAFALLPHVVLLPHPWGEGPRVVLRTFTPIALMLAIMTPWSTTALVVTVGVGAALALGLAVWAWFRWMAVDGATVLAPTDD